MVELDSVKELRVFGTGACSSTADGQRFPSHRATALLSDTHTGIFAANGHDSRLLLLLSVSKSRRVSLLKYLFP
jgi:hypothetical protein